MALFSKWKENRQWNAALEAAARQAELRMVFGGEPPTPHHKQVVEHIAAAIRDLKRSNEADA